MDALGFLAILVAIICGGYLYLDYTKDKEGQVKGQNNMLDDDIQKGMLIQLKRNEEILSSIKHILVAVAVILFLILIRLYR